MYIRISLTKEKIHKLTCLFYEKFHCKIPSYMILTVRVAQNSFNKPFSSPCFISCPCNYQKTWWLYEQKQNICLKWGELLKTKKKNLYRAAFYNKYLLCHSQNNIYIFSYSLCLSLYGPKYGLGSTQNKGQNHHK